MGVVHNSPVMKQIIFAAAVFVVALSQDTNYCPDGWYVSDFDDKIECIYFGSQTEQVTKTDASVLCAARGVGWWIWTRGEVQLRITSSSLFCLNMLAKEIHGDQECSGIISGGLEQSVVELTVNTTGETGPGTTLPMRLSGMTG